MNGSSHSKYENLLKNNVLARILALFMGAARPRSVAQRSGCGSDSAHDSLHAGPSNR